jgi:hypothetical protein
MTRLRHFTASQPSFTPVRARLLQRACACGGTPGLEGECKACRKKRLGLQRRTAGEAAISSVPPIVGEVLRSPGKPLDPAARAFMEPRFGHDFGRVRVHTDEKAAESARAVNALAYAVGNHVAFAPGRYAPATVPGRRLLAHELAHVVQQREDIRTEPVAIDPADTLAEREARSAAGVVLDGGASRPLASVSSPVLRRADDEGWMETASEYWGDIKEQAYKAMIDNMRGAQARGLRQLRALTRDMPPVQRILAGQIITQVEIATDLLISFILAVVGLAVGLVSGLAKALWGLLQVVYGLLYGLILFVAGFFSERRRAEFDERANAVLEALKNLPNNLRTLMGRWKAEWDRANPDRKTLMIGELTGEIEAILVTALLGGHVAGQAPKVTVSLVPARQFATAGGSFGAGGLTATIDVAGPSTAGALTAAVAMSVDESAKQGPAEKETKPPKGEEVFEEAGQELKLDAPKKSKSKGLSSKQQQQFIEEAKAAEMESMAGSYQEKFKALHPDFPGGREWQVHHSIPQKFRQILRNAGIDVDNPSFLRGARTTPGEFSNVHAKLTTNWENWHAKFKALHGREPNAAEILEQAKQADWQFRHLYWEVQKMEGIPVPTK